MAMKAYRIKANSAELLAPQAPHWGKAVPEIIDLAPTPLAGMVDHVSPFLAADSLDHGRVGKLAASALHNGQVLAIRLSWQGEAHTAIRDLDQFVDGAAILFPMSKEANAITMGQKGAPVNAWFWRANHPDTPFDVIAEGFGSSERRSGTSSHLTSKAIHDGSRWTLVLQRPLSAGHGHVAFTPGAQSGIAFAVWDGGNKERSGRKAISGEFLPLVLEK